MPGRAWKGSRAPRACRDRALRGGPCCSGAGGRQPTPPPLTPPPHKGPLLRRCWFNGATSPSSPSPLIRAVSALGTSVPDNHLPGRFVTAPDVIGELLFFFFFFPYNPPHFLFLGSRGSGRCPLLPHPWAAPCFVPTCADLQRSFQPNKRDGWDAGWCSCGSGAELPMHAWKPRQQCDPMEPLLPAAPTRGYLLANQRD